MPPEYLPLAIGVVAIAIVAAGLFWLKDEWNGFEEPPEPSRKEKRAAKRALVRAKKRAAKPGKGDSLVSEVVGDLVDELLD